MVRCRFAVVPLVLCCISLSSAVLASDYAEVWRSPFGAVHSVSWNPTDSSVWVGAGGSVMHVASDGAVLSQTPGYSYVRSVSVNSTDGSCWATDSGAGLVAHLAADGTELLRLDTYTNPDAVSVDPTTGFCWLVDASDSLLLRLDTGGTELLRVEGFTNPNDVSADPTDGSCWVSNGNASQIVHVAADGTKTTYTGYTAPGGVSADPTDGSCWVADTSGNRVVHLSSGGVQTPYTGFSSPISVSADPTDGTCWVADYSADTVTHIKPGDTNVVYTGFDWSICVSANTSDGTAWVADQENRELVHLAADGSEALRIGYIYDPSCVSVNSDDGSCWIGDSSNHTIIHVDADGAELWSDSYSEPLSVSVDPTDGSCRAAGDFGVARFLSDGTEDWLDWTTFSYPVSVSVDPTDGSCWVADTGYDKVWRLDIDGEVIWSGSFMDPASVSVDASSGACWVADTGNDRVVRIDPGDSYSTIVATGFSGPTSVSADSSDGSCWAADYGNLQLVHLSATGSELYRSSGTEIPARFVSADPASGSCWVSLMDMGPSLAHIGANGAVLWLAPAMPDALSVNPADGSLWYADPDGKQVVHLAPLPVAGFSAAPLSGVAPLVVDFADLSTGSPTSWLWDFGDGGTSTEEDPSHTYTSVGRHTVSLTVTNAAGEATEWKTLLIAVYFPDVDEENWAAEEVLDCAEYGIVSGYGDGLYHPDWPVTRDQMAVYIARALAGGEAHVPDGPDEATFEDVPTDYWAYDHIEYCYDQKVVQGYTPTTYEPTNEVTRDQMAVYMARALVAPDGDDALADYVPDDPRNFPDVPVDFWAYSHVEYCVEHLVVQGYVDGSYHPDDVVTRDQMAVYVARSFPGPPRLSGAAARPSHWTPGLR